MFNVYLEASTFSKASCVAGTERPPSTERGISEGMGPGHGGSLAVLGERGPAPHSACPVQGLPGTDMGQALL